MSMRHKAIKATLDKGLASEWNDDHLDDFGDETSHNCIFVGIPLSVEWDFIQTVGGNNPTLVLQDHHTHCLLETTADTGDISSMRHEFNGAAGNITHVNDSPIMNMAVWMEAYHIVDEVAEFGLIDSATAAAFTANQDGAYFRIKDNKLYAVTGDGAAETETDITPAGGIPEYGNYRIELSPAHAYFYVNNMETAKTDNTVNLPDSNLTMKFSVQSQNNVNTLMYVDAVALQRLRYKG